MLDLKNKAILITGGTGSFGKKFVELFLKKFPELSRLVVFSRDALKQHEMAKEFPRSKYPNIEYQLGDIRDRDRLLRAFEGIDYVIHAAALKYVPEAELNPLECIKTNVLGAENIIEAALERKVRKVIALSTDKAAAPVSLYGATKLCSDKLFIAANHLYPKTTIFSVVRYGNVIGSKGSVLPAFLSQKKSGVIYVTDPSMTRFNITSEVCVNFVEHALENSWGGEIFIPKLYSFKIGDLAKAVAPECEIKVTGIRPGEKINEDMITETDSLNTFEFEDHFVTLPSFSEWRQEEWVKFFSAKKVNPGFKYDSMNNDKWLSIADLQEEVKKFLKENAS